MNKISIDRYRIVPAPLTGIGWVAVQEWDDDAGEYLVYYSVRSFKSATENIDRKTVINFHGAFKTKLCVSSYFVF